MFPITIKCQRTQHSSIVTGERTYTHTRIDSLASWLGGGGGGHQKSASYVTSDHRDCQSNTLKTTGLGIYCITLAGLVEAACQVWFPQQNKEHFDCKLQRESFYGIVKTYFYARNAPRGTGFQDCLCPPSLCKSPQTHPQIRLWKITCHVRIMHLGDATVCPSISV